MKVNEEQAKRLASQYLSVLEEESKQLLQHTFMNFNKSITS